MTSQISHSTLIGIILVFIILSFSVILLSEELIINPNNETSNNNSKNNSKQKLQEPDSDPKFKILNIVYLLIPLIGGYFLGIIKARSNIKHKEKRETIIEFRKTLNELFCKINTYSNIINYVSTEVNASIPIIDRAVKSIENHVTSRKSKKISTAYNDYKKASTNYDDKFVGQLSLFYDFNEEKMKEIYGKDTKFKTGKELCLHDIQKIIDLVK